MVGNEGDERQKLKMEYPRKRKKEKNRERGDESDQWEGEELKY